MTADSLVLLVCPSAKDGAALGGALCAPGLRIVQVQSGAEAIRTLRTVTPDAIVFHGELPDSSERQIAALFQALCPQAVRLFVGPLGPSMSRHAAEGQPRGDVPRDVDLSVLARRLRQALARRSQSAKGTEPPQRLLAVCAWCGSVRNAAGEWHNLGRAEWLSGEERCTHGICPECMGSQERLLGMASSA